MTHKNVFFLYSDIRKGSGIYANPKRIEDFATLESNMTSFICINQFTIFHSSLTKFYYTNSSIVLKKNNHKIRYKKKCKGRHERRCKNRHFFNGCNFNKISQLLITYKTNNAVFQQQQRLDE